MKKINFTLLVCLLLAGIFASCDDDDKYPVPPEVSIESVNGVFRMAIGIIVAIFSTIAFFGFILWLFTL